MGRSSAVGVARPLRCRIGTYAIRNRHADGSSCAAIAIDRGATGGRSSLTSGACPASPGTCRLLSGHQFRRLLLAGRVLPHLRSRNNRTDRYRRSDHL